MRYNGTALVEVMLPRLLRSRSLVEKVGLVLVMWRFLVPYVVFVDGCCS